ncbi:hypothetical protein [Methylobacterium sp. J-090]|uniref:hypothetical protein n=1 Tax=Methylobacterium sp. J-090 TaxID=2836666 RepID=UPI001FB89EA3|nr:hypothetical protein [Methylobacterium sp. J-090]MCJ2081543.1 hypothetical protein [Methylobacterium sp. J-090]
MAKPSNISDTRFDGAAIWAGLTPEYQAKIGAYALEAAIARGISEHAGGPAERAAIQAVTEAHDMLQEAVLGDGGLNDRQWIDGGERFRIPSVIGLVCQSCGCSHDDPCEEGCGWATETTCTACAT